LFWSFSDLEKVIQALITTRILEQFIAQIIGAMLLRRREPDRPRPYRIWLYPLPCGVALAGWFYLYFSADLPFIQLGLATLVTGVLIYLVWSRTAKSSHFGKLSEIIKKILDKWGPAGSTKGSVNTRYWRGFDCPNSRQSYKSFRTKRLDQTELTFSLILCKPFLQVNSFR